MSISATISAWSCRYCAALLLSSQIHLDPSTWQAASAHPVLVFSQSVFQHLWEYQRIQTNEALRGCECVEVETLVCEQCKHWCNPRFRSSYLPIWTIMSYRDYHSNPLSKCCQCYQWCAADPHPVSDVFHRSILGVYWQQRGCLCHLASFRGSGHSASH